MSYADLVLSVNNLAEKSSELKVAAQNVQVASEEARDSSEAFAIDALSSVTESQNLLIKAPLDAAQAAQVVLANKIDRSELVDPTKGTTLIHRNGLYGDETTEVALARQELTGQEAGIVKFQGINPGQARLFLAGYDSLTAGAGGSSWHRYFRKIMRGQLGYGGPGLQLFSGEVASSESAQFGVSGLNAIAENGINYAYSIGGYGVYATAADGSAYMNWSPSGAWDTVRVFYLKQPGGGTFRIGTNDQANEAKILVDTANSVRALGYVDVPIGKGTSGQTLAVRAGTGTICLFGGLFTLGTKGFMFGNIAKGGRKLADVAAQDSELRKQWFAALQPSHFMLNGGANDKDTRTAAQHNADLTTIISDVQSVSPNTAIVMVQHNHISGENTTYLPAHALEKIAVAKAKGLGYFDIRRLLGRYVDANANGLMFDGTHPSDKANRSIASWYAQNLGFSGNAADPGETAYGGGAGGAVIQRSGSLTTKQLVALTGVKTAIYTLGLTAGYPAVTLRLTVTSNRTGTRISTTKLLLISIGNSITTNAVTGTSVPAVVYSVSDVNGSATAGDFTITSEIVGDKCVISVTPTSYDSSIVAECDFAAPYNTVVGAVVFEN